MWILTHFKMSLTSTFAFYFFKCHSFSLSFIRYSLFFLLILNFIFITRLGQLYFRLIYLFSLYFYNFFSHSVTLTVLANLNITIYWNKHIPSLFIYFQSIRFHCVGGNLFVFFIIFLPFYSLIYPNSVSLLNFINSNSFKLIYIRDSLFSSKYLSFC